MTRTGWAALVVAVLISAYSIAEAVAVGLTGQPMLDPEAGPKVALATVGLLLTLTFALSAAVLRQQGARLDAGSRPRRWLRRVLQVDLAVGAAVGAITVALTPFPRSGSIEEMLGAVGGVAFILAFVLGAALGLSLIRRPELRPAAVCLSAIAALIPLTILMGILQSPWGHIAYTETALYIGIALLARKPQPDEMTGPAQHTGRQHIRTLTITMQPTGTADSDLSRPRLVDAAGQPTPEVDRCMACISPNRATRGCAQHDARKLFRRFQARFVFSQAVG